MSQVLGIRIVNNNTNDYQSHIVAKQHCNAFDSDYQLSNDLASFASSPTTSTSSRRSSNSSYSTSLLSTASSKKHHSLPPTGSTSSNKLYPTLNSALERIEYLEEQLKSRRESNEAIVKNVSFQIDTFLENRKKGNLSTTTEELLLSHSDTKSAPAVGPLTEEVIDKLDELKDLVSEYNLIICKDKEPGIDKKLDIFFSAQIIENWINSATQHNTSKRDLQNVDSTRHHRLSQAIQSLSEKHTSTKKQLRTLSKSESLLKQKLNKAQQVLVQQQKENTNLAQDKEEIEQLLDEVRAEMENMMEELNQVKLDRQRCLDKSNRLEEDLKAIQGDEEDADIVALQSLLRESEIQTDQLKSDHQEQLDSLSNQNKTIKTQLEAAQRSVAELSLVVEVQKRQKLNTEMEEILRRTLAKKDGELAKLKLELEKSQKQTEHMKIHRNKEMQVELTARLEDLESTLKSQYQRESHTYQVKISREVRELTCSLMELETELQELRLEHEKDVQKLSASQTQLQTLQHSLGKKESEHQQELNRLEQKSQTLEEEVLLLYSKNLQLAQHLGELDS